MFVVFALMLLLMLVTLCGAILLTIAGALFLIFLPLRLLDRRRGRATREFGRAARDVAIIAGHAQLMAPAVASALGRMPGLRAVRIEQSGAVLAERGRSWRSWGEHIRVRLSPVGGDWTYAAIESRSKLCSTLFDYGRNVENVALVSAALQQIT